MGKSDMDRGDFEQQAVDTDGRPYKVMIDQIFRGLGKSDKDRGSFEQQAADRDGRPYYVVIDQIMRGVR